MNPLIEVGIVTCVGLTPSFDVHLMVNPHHATAELSVMDIDGHFEINEFSVKGTVDKNCFVSQDLEFCLKGSDATLTLYLPTENGAPHMERGRLKCK